LTTMDIKMFGMTNQYLKGISKNPTKLSINFVS
jgi:hypothetical protein